MEIQINFELDWNKSKEEITEEFHANAKIAIDEK